MSGNYTDHPRKATEAVEGKWWKFSKYELRGQYIRPAPSAKLEQYDPWDAYGPDSTPPYQSLLDLIRKVRLTEAIDEQAERLRLGLDIESDESKSLLLDWCARFGLLGILPHQVHMVLLLPRWSKAQRPGHRSKEPPNIRYMNIRDVLSPQREEAGARLIPNQIQYSRANGRWTAVSHGNALPGCYTTDLSLEGQGVPSEFFLDEWPRRPATLIQHLHQGGRLTLERFLGTWCQFFPDVPRDEIESFQYPLPLSKAFWDLYSESINIFFAGAKLLEGALRTLGSRKARPLASQWAINDATKDMNTLISSVGSLVEPVEGGGFRRRWASLSLLGSLAMMAVQDLATGRVRVCDSCARPFYSDAYQAAFCEPRCKWRETKRRKKREGKEDQG